MRPWIRRVSYLPPTSHADTTTMIVELADTTTAARQRALAGTQVMFANGTRTAQEWEERRQVPVCSQCLRWGHGRALCRANSVTCEQCGEAHDVRHHRTLASCCRGSDAAACEHPPYCVNCGQAHRATARVCPFYAHRKDHAWHQLHQPVGRRAPREHQAAPGPSQDTEAQPRPSVRFAPHVEVN